MDSDISKLNEAIFDALGATKEQEEAALDALGKLGDPPQPFIRRITPPLIYSNDELDRAVPTDRPVRVVDKEEEEEQALDALSKLGEPPVMPPVDAVNNFTRQQVRENGFMRRVMPPLKISDDELDRSVPTCPKFARWLKEQMGDSNDCVVVPSRPSDEAGNV